MVNIIWFGFDLIRFRKDFSVCCGKMRYVTQFRFIDNKFWIFSFILPTYFFIKHFFLYSYNLLNLNFYAGILVRVARNPCQNKIFPSVILKTLSFLSNLFHLIAYAIIFWRMWKDFSSVCLWAWRLDEYLLVGVKIGRVRTFLITHAKLYHVAFYLFFIILLFEIFEFLSLEFFL